MGHYDAQQKFAEAGLAVLMYQFDTVLGTKNPPKRV